jgi:carboxypeptidase Taq
MLEYLFIKPENDADGVMQDVHWSAGLFGYFPSYLLGSIYDGMFLEKLIEDLGSVDEILAEGRIKEITKWLNENIHKYGGYREPKEVIETVCGRKMSVKPLVNYFKNKYAEVYELSL